MSYGKLDLREGMYEILSVEKGSIFSKPDDPTIAFTIDVNGKKIKAILTGSKAKHAWYCYLTNGKSKSEIGLTVDNVTVDKNVFATFSGDIYDITKDEIKLKNPKITFSFNYTI